jgi:hypothetical protein
VTDQMQDQGVLFELCLGVATVQSVMAKALACGRFRLEDAPPAAEQGARAGA